MMHGWIIICYYCDIIDHSYGLGPVENPFEVCEVILLCMPGCVISMFLVHLRTVLALIVRAQLMAT